MSKTVIPAFPGCELRIYTGETDSISQAIIGWEIWAGDRVRVYPITANGLHDVDAGGHDIYINGEKQ